MTASKSTDNHYLKKHLGGEPPIYPYRAINLSYNRKNSYAENSYLASPYLIQKKFSKGPILPSTIVHLPSFTFAEDEFNQLYTSYSFLETCKMFELYRDLNGNFIILADRLDKPIVEVQKWYYDIFNGIKRLRRQPVTYPAFDYDRELRRRAAIEKLMQEGNTEELKLAMSYYSFQEKCFIPSGFKKLPETEVSVLIPQGLPGSHYLGRGMNGIRDQKDREIKHELMKKQGVHLVTSLLPQPKQNTVQKAHDIILEFVKDGKNSALSKSLYPSNLSKFGGMSFPSTPLLSKYLKVRMLAMKVAESRKKKSK
eukprot:NODE_168_length_14557_cov_0.729008.p6 type:complete len:311 gc:universal NODE_168_length_14557_cov_0.729008:5565-4633(-)